MRVSLSKEKFLNIIITLAIFAFMFLGILVSFNSKNLANRIEVKTLPLFIFAMGMWLIVPIKRCQIKSEIKSVYYFFCLVNAVGAIMRLDVMMLLSSFFAILLFFFMSRSFQYIEFEKLYTTISIGMLLAGGFSISQFGIAVFNSQGVIYAFVGIMALNLLCLKRIEKIIPFASIVLATIAVLAVTRSRTSMAGFLLVAIISYAYLFLKKFTIKNFFIVVMLIMIALYSTNYITTYFEQIFFHKWGNADLTSNRTFIWKTVIDNISIFGHGINHLNGGDAHNTFMQVLGCDGILCALVLVLLLFTIIKCIIRADNKMVYINFFVSWLFISCFENLDILTSRLLPVNTLFVFHLLLLTRELRKTNYKDNYYGQKI